jgi:hypothetical protein
LARAQPEVKVKVEFTEGYRKRFTEAVLRQITKRGARGYEKEIFIGRPDTGSHGADQNGRESCTVAGRAGNADVLLR